MYEIHKHEKLFDIHNKRIATRIFSQTSISCHWPQLGCECNQLLSSILASQDLRMILFTNNYKSFTVTYSFILNVTIYCDTLSRTFSLIGLFMWKCMFLKLFSSQVLLPQKDHWHGVCLLCLSINILQTSQKVFDLWVSIFSEFSYNLHIALYRVICIIYCFKFL